MRRYRLDKKEQELLEFIKEGKWKPVKHMETQIGKYAGYAGNPTTTY